MCLRDHFDADINDAHQYDMTINTDHMSFGDVVDLIVDRVQVVRGRLRKTDGVAQA